MLAVAPEIHPPMKLRLREAKATAVVLNGQWPDGRANLVKGTNDVWSVTVGPIKPGVWGEVRPLP